MKVSGRDARRFCAAPPANVIGALLHGSDGGLIAARRQQIVRAAAGSDEPELVRIDASEARRGPAAVEAALRTRGFFGGRPVVLIDGGTDGLARPLAAAIEDVTVEDGFLVVTAEALPARSALRKLFEGHASLAAIALYPDAMDMHEIEAFLSERGMTCGIVSGAASMLASLAGEMDHGGFLQFLELVALTGLDRTDPLEAADIAALAPAGLESDIDTFVDAIASGRPASVGPLLRRLQAAGANPVAILIALQRHFRLLLTAQSAHGGVAGLRPPLSGPRRDRVMQQLRTWHGSRLEQANRLLFEADGRLRSAANIPDFALVERTALRLAMMAQR